MAISNHPFDDGYAKAHGHPTHEHNKSECRCGKSDNDAVLIELIKLFSTFITEVKKMSANTDALKASISVVDGKLDLLIAKPPVVVSDGVDEMLPEITASVDALGAKIDAALAPVVPAA